VVLSSPISDHLEAYKRDAHSVFLSCLSESSITPPTLARVTGQFSQSYFCSLTTPGITSHTPLCLRMELRGQASKHTDKSPRISCFSVSFPPFSDTTSTSICTMPHYENEPKIDTSAETGDWRESLFRDGYVVVKGVLSPEKAKSYQDRMLQWLETFPYGFNASDPSTWTKEHLPEHMK
jgi:hypothetical protein